MPDLLLRRVRVDDVDQPDRLCVVKRGRVTVTPRCTVKVQPGLGQPGGRIRTEIGWRGPRFGSCRRGGPAQTPA
jgi:hypothetical protein